MTGKVGRAPEDWRNYSDKVPLAAFALRQGDLRKLYKIVNDKQVEFRDKYIEYLIQRPNETSEESVARKARFYNSFVTSMTVNTMSGENLFGNNAEFLDETNLPDQIRSILFTTVVVPQTVGVVPVNRVVLFLDFTRPPVFDFTRLPSLPTPNDSYFEVASDNESLFSATRARLNDFFKERKTRVNWLHGGAIYDVGVYLLGIPFSMWAVFKFSKLLTDYHTLPTIIEASVYVYVFFLVMNIFRIFFMYSRWVFPKIGLVSEKSTPLRHRGVWAAITIALLISVIPDLLRLVL